VRATGFEMLAGVGLDVLIGDPQWLPHPVRGFGWLAARLESLFRSAGLPLRLAGVLFWLSAVSVAGAAVAASVVWLPRPWISIYWIFALLAIRDLEFEAALVVRALRAQDLEGARRLLGRIVGRDTGSLDEAEVMRATVETVAENLSDAVVAPLFYLALAGPVGIGVYKAINTLDSMVGYRNIRYGEFGWASARADDLANLIPARLTAVLIWCCALILRYDTRRSVTVTLRDARRQPSPNSGYPEAAVAGALGIRLGGLNYYDGVPSRKEFLGDPVFPLSAGLFPKLRAILYGTAALMVLGAAGVMPWR
jgi:adenosylcobinamide-phosphate synthase